MKHKTPEELSKEMDILEKDIKFWKEKGEKNLEDMYISLGRYDKIKLKLKK